MNKILAFIPTLLVAIVPYSQATDFFVTAEGGRTDTDFNAGFTADGSTESVYSTVLTGNIGLKLQSFVLGVGYSNSVSDNFLNGFDSYTISQKQLFLGYRFKLNDHFRITPQVGMVSWDLTAEEARLFSDKNNRGLKYSGDDTYTQINLEFPVNKLITVVGSLSRTNYDFGSTSSIQAGVIFEFD